MADAFFVPTDDPERFLATPRTEGPWDAGLQHAGPPSALVARAVDRLPTTIPGAVQIARLTLEILGAIPVTELAVRATVARPGRSVELVEADLVADDRLVLRARAWRIRDAPSDLPDSAITRPAQPPGRPPQPTAFADPAWQAGYLRAVEWRFVEGHFERPGPATVWARQRVPLVAGEEPTGLQRLMVLADSGNGLSRTLEVADWWFINTELTVHLFRAPVGEWMCVQARTTLGSRGAGLAETVLFDDEGRVGRGAQALLVGPRR